MDESIKQALTTISGRLIPLKEKLGITANICSKAGQQPTGRALTEVANLADNSHSLIEMLTSGDKEPHRPEMIDIFTKVGAWVSLCEQFCITALVTESDHELRSLFAEILPELVRLEQPVMQILSAVSQSQSSGNQPLSEMTQSGRKS